MNPSTDSDPHHSGTAHGGETPLPSNWREALLSLVASRVALIQLESKQAASDGAKRAITVVAAGICFFFTWSLLLAGGIVAISNATDWPWHWIAMAAAATHLLAAVIFLNIAKSPQHRPFSVTRSEFQKDHEWIQKFQTTRKSND